MRKLPLFECCILIKKNLNSSCSLRSFCQKKLHSFVDFESLTVDINRTAVLSSARNLEVRT